MHFSQAGFPVAGDALYGGGEEILSRLVPLLQTPAAGLLKRLTSQALHAERLAFAHPRDGKPMEFTSPLPEEFRKGLEYLERYRRKAE